MPEQTEVYYLWRNENATRGRERQAGAAEALFANSKIHLAFCGSLEANRKV